VTGLSEEHLSMSGTEGAMRRANATQDPDMPAVVVTGSIAEMIGGGVTPEGSGPAALHPAHDRRGPVAGADRAIYWLWTEFGPKKVKRKARGRGVKAAGQHHRSDLRHLQHAVRPGRNPPPGRRHRLRDQPGVSRSARMSRISAGWRTPT
jgi:hypothetical protein